MGRLPVVTLFALLSVACNDDKKREPGATGQRSQVVSATVAAPASTPTSRASAVTPPRPRKPPRKLCAGELDKPGRGFPDKPISRANAPGAGQLPGKPRVGAGAWTWVNFWAAWCVPCKEEMPRLIDFEKKLRAAGKKLDLTFVSLDDDQRQLDDSLGAAPANGVRASYWLREGKERQEWLSLAGIEEDPELPTHLLVDPEGKVRCRVKGAVEDSDFASLSEIVGG